MTKQKEYHILSLSGGKDSTALAFFIKDNMPEVYEQLEMVFVDTECEIPETYDYLNKIEMFLKKDIIRLKPYVSFDHIYQMRKILPSVNRRWCTVELKTKTFRKYVHELLKNERNSKIILYIGIRGDESHRAEDRDKYQDNFINERFPFVEKGIIRKDVDDILNSAGIGYPDYYRWRKRSGCYFCMYQSKMDWLNLYENHPDLFYKAMDYEIEETDYGKKQRFGWNVDMPLKDMIKPENMAIIKENYKKLVEKKYGKNTNLNSNLIEIFGDTDEKENMCSFCHL